jgi:hypothetical protein
MTDNTNLNLARFALAEQKARQLHEAWAKAGSNPRFWADFVPDFLLQCAWDLQNAEG